MFYRLSAIIAASFAVLTVANPLEVRASTSECNTGGIYCCQSTQSVSWSDYSSLWSVWGISAPASNSLVGFTCSPVTVGGTGTGGNCVSQPVCCTDVVFVRCILSEMLQCETYNDLPERCYECWLQPHHYHLLSTGNVGIEGTGHR
ncbi:hypothetical protein ID866_7422 [Astraeus odoratus]|nr:hypothetical protein ID866_7422 [Astraeus odoratus]